MTESPKLRMQEPNVQDFTDNRVGIFQASQFDAAVKKAYWRGVEDASLPTIAILALTLLLALPTADFKDFATIPGATWRAVFLLLLVCASLGSLSLFIRKCLKVWPRSQTPGGNIGLFSEDVPLAQGNRGITSDSQNAPKLLQPLQAIDQKNDRRPFKGVRKK